MTSDESVAWHKVSTSIQFENGRYVVAAPWRNERPSLPNNRPLAEKRLESTERKVEKNPEIAEAYQKVIEEYLEKNYIRRVPLDEPTPSRSVTRLRRLMLQRRTFAMSMKMERLAQS